MNFTYIFKEHHTLLLALGWVNESFTESKFPLLLLLLSTDLDTSEDFSAELDRSHGFFTASGEGKRGRYIKEKQTISSGIF